MYQEKLTHNLIIYIKIIYIIIISIIIYIYIKMSEWLMFVKAYALKNNISFLVCPMDRGNSIS